MADKMDTLPGKAELIPPLSMADYLPEGKAWRRYVGREDDFQKAAAKFLDSLKVKWAHAANERTTKQRQSKDGRWYSPEGSKMRALGVKRGFPDIMIYESINGCAGFAAELKVWPNKPTPEQIQWLEHLRKNGWWAVTYWSLDELIHDVKKYLGR